MSDEMLTTGDSGQVHPLNPHSVTSGPKKEKFLPVEAKTDEAGSIILGVHRSLEGKIVVPKTAPAEDDSVVGEGFVETVKDSVVSKRAPTGLSPIADCTDKLQELAQKASKVKANLGWEKLPLGDAEVRLRPKRVVAAKHEVDASGKQTSKFYDMFINFFKILISQVLIKPVMANILDLIYRSMKKQIGSLKFNNIITDAESFALNQCLGNSARFQVEMDKVIDRLNLQNSDELKTLSSKYRFSEVLTSITLSKHDQAVNSFVTDISNLVEELGSTNDLQQLRGLTRGTVSPAQRKQAVKEMKSILGKMGKEERKIRHLDALYTHLTTTKITDNEQLSTILSAHLFYRGKQQELDELCADLHSIRSSIAPLKNNIINVEAREQLIAVENIFKDLHKSFGLIGQALKKDPALGPDSTAMVGTFRRQFGTLNGMWKEFYQILYPEDQYSHITTGDNFAGEIKRGYWSSDDVRHNFKKQELFEGNPPMEVDDPIMIKETIMVRGERVEIERPARACVLMCNIGSGHKSATKAMAQALPDVDINVADVYDHLLENLDWGKLLSPDLSAESVSNEMAAKEQFGLMNFSEYFADIYNNPIRKAQIRARVKEYVLSENPDELISAIPILDGVFCEVAQELDIPLRIVTTDTGISDFTRGLTERHLEYDKLRITFAYGQEKSIDKLGKKHFGKNMSDRFWQKLQKKIDWGFAYPTRLTFNQEVDLPATRKEFNIAEDQNAILVMMGGNAAPAALDYAELISEMTAEELAPLIANAGTDGVNPGRLKLMCLCGQPGANRELRGKLETINQELANRFPHPQKPPIEICAVDQTPKIAELESLPEMGTLITKPGGGSVSEAVKKGLPILCHIKGKELKWETGNKDWVVKNKIGNVFDPTQLEKGWTERGKIAARTVARKELAQKLADNFAKRKELLDNPSEEMITDFTKNIRAGLRGDLGIS